MTSNRYRSDYDSFDYPQPQRWDSARFSRESESWRRGGAPVIEQRPPYESTRRGDHTVYDDRRYYEDDYYSGPRGTRDRQFYEEDEYYDPRANSGAMVPFRPEAPPRPSAPPRPARPRMVRRQSSVDRIDFERRRYYDDYRPPPPPPPRESRQSRYDIRIYDDVKVQDPDYYGDDGFREYREREWTRSRARSHSRSPSPDRRTSVRAASRSEFIEAAPPEAYEEETKIVEEEKIVEKPYPRRGKTRMPKRLVHTKVLFDLGYPFYEEDEKTILIEKALGPDNIDEVFAKSREYREIEIKTKAIEAPPISTKSISEAPRSVRDWDQMNRSPSPGSSISQATRRTARRGSMHESIHKSIHETERESRHGGSVHESFHESIHKSRSRSVSPAPTGRTSRHSRAKSRGSFHESIHESIHKTRSVSPGRSSRHSRARSRGTTHRSSRHSSSDDTTIIEKKTIIEERSPARTFGTRSRRATSVGGTEIIERKIIESDEIDESNSIDIGPLALVSGPKSRTDVEIREEIRRLERERRDLRRDTEIIRYDRRTRRDSSPLGLLREPSPRGEIIIADRRDDEVVAVRKDKRARSRSRPPGAALLKSMMYTVT